MSEQDPLAAIIQAEIEEIEAAVKRHKSRLVVLRNTLQSLSGVRRSTAGWTAEKRAQRAERTRMRWAEAKAAGRPRLREGD